MSQQNDTQVNIPSTWEIVRLKDISRKITDGSHSPPPKQNSGTPMLSAINIQSGLISFESIRYISDSDFQKEYSRANIETGDVLLTIVGSIGRTAVVKESHPKFAIQRSVALIKPFGVNSKYLSFSFENPIFQKQLAEKSKGTAQKGVYLKTLSELKVFLPPLAEQHRIIEKIEELFSDLDDGIASLKKAQQQLKVYRQAVLKWAFEGKLTAQWREEQKRQGKLESAATLLEQIKAERERRYQAELAQWQADVEAWEANGKVGKRPGKPGKLITPILTKDELEDLPELPQGWQWVFPEGICAPENYSLAIGPFGSNLKVSDYTNSGTPLVFVRHITSRNFDLNPKYISREKFIELLPHGVKSLDLLITKMGDPPGDCEIYPEGREEAVITADCLKFTIWSDYASRKFYKYCINSTLIKKQLGLITQGVAQKKISLERFKHIKFPFPNLTEQNQIVEEIESRLSICDQLESEINANLDRAEALRQSILKQAFEGKLVSQDPNDEPASVLLERIRAAKASQSNNGIKTRENRQGSTQQELFP